MLLAPTEQIFFFLDIFFFSLKGISLDASLFNGLKVTRNVQPDVSSYVFLLSPLINSHSIFAPDFKFKYKTQCAFARRLRLEIRDTAGKCSM